MGNFEAKKCVVTGSFHYLPRYSPVENLQYCQAFLEVFESALDLLDRVKTTFFSVLILFFGIGSNYNINIGKLYTHQATTTSIKYIYIYNINSNLGLSWPNVVTGVEAVKGLMRRSLSTLTNSAIYDR